MSFSILRTITHEDFVNPLKLKSHQFVMSRGPNNYTWKLSSGKDSIFPVWIGYGSIDLYFN